MNLSFHYQSEDSCADFNARIAPPFSSQRSCWLLSLEWFSFFEHGVTSSISCKHMTIWYPFFKSQHTTYHSEIGVWIRRVTKQWVPTLPVDCANSTFQQVNWWRFPIPWNKNKSIMRVILLLNLIVCRKYQNLTVLIPMVGFFHIIVHCWSWWLISMNIYILVQHWLRTPPPLQLASSILFLFDMKANVISLWTKLNKDNQWCTSNLFHHKGHGGVQ